MNRMEISLRWWNQNLTISDSVVNVFALHTETYFYVIQRARILPNFPYLTSV